MRLPLTYLFVPAHETRKVEKALGSDVDAVILDLEDSVPSDAKTSARAHAAAILTETSGLAPEIWVRTNAGVEFDADVAALDWPRAAGAVLSKAERPEQVRTLALAGVRRVIPLIESVTGVFAVSSLAGAAPVVDRLAIGTWDLSLDLELTGIVDPDESPLIWQVRGMLVLESRRLDLNPPVDGVWANLNDEDGLREACRRSRQMGFWGKLIIHPAQAPVVRDAFSPDAAAIAQAMAVVEAFHEAEGDDRGAVAVNGRMVDWPVFERARRLLERAGLGNT